MQINGGDLAEKNYDKRLDGIHPKMGAGRPNPVHLAHRGRKIHLCNANDQINH